MEKVMRQSPTACCFLLIGLNEIKDSSIDFPTLFFSKYFAYITNFSSNSGNSVLFCAAVLNSIFALLRSLGLILILTNGSKKLSFVSDTRFRAFNTSTCKNSNEDLPMHLQGTKTIYIIYLKKIIADEMCTNG